MKQALLVEDDAIVARLTRMLLVRAGWEVEWVETGRQAIDVLSNRRYSLVLLDIGLPDIDGYGVTLWLRHFEKDRGVARTPILVVSASEVKRRASLDVDGVLQKPLRMNALETALHELEASP